MQPGHIDAENERKWSTSMRINSSDRELSRPQCGCTPCSRNTDGNTSRWSVCSSRKRSRVGVQNTSETSRSYFSFDIVHSCSSSRIALSIFYLLAVAILVGSSRSSTKDRDSVKKGNTSFERNGTVVAISSSSFWGEPLKEKTEGADKGKARWMRVKSARAAHPAMYVPGDGLVYCPIAKIPLTLRMIKQATMSLRKMDLVLDAVVPRTAGIAYGNELEVMRGDFLQGRGVLLLGEVDVLGAGTFLRILAWRHRLLRFDILYEQQYPPTVRAPSS